MLRHVVLLEWNDGVSQKAMAAFTAGLAELPAAIPQVRRYEYGADLGIAGGTADFVICADFDSAEDYLVYRDHPAHQAFKAEHLLPHTHGRSAAQFELS